MKTKVRTNITKNKKPAAKTIKKAVSKLMNTKTSKSYATTINATLNRTAHDVVTIEQRFTRLLATNKEFRDGLQIACKTFSLNNPNIKTWADLRLPKGLTASMASIKIDTTQQREVNAKHLLKIIKKFNRMVVQSLCVNESQEDQCMNVWDGQHTVLALYIIAKHILKIESLEDIMVPVTIYEPDYPSQTREAFIELNSTARSPFDYVDHFRQHVMARRVDNDPKYEMAHRKQLALEAVGMFVTHEKFNDEDQPGAFSNMSDFKNDKDYSLKVHSGYCQWVLATCGGSRTVTRPTGGIESYQVYKFLLMCEKAKIDFSKDNYQYIRDVVDTLMIAYNGEFTPDNLQERAMDSFDRFWTTTMHTKDHGVKYDRKVAETHFMIEQIAHHNPTLPVPAFSKSVRGIWPIPVTDL